jgi:hypothetical protein
MGEILYMAARPTAWMFSCFWFSDIVQRPFKNGRFWMSTISHPLSAKPKKKRSWLNAGRLPVEAPSRNHRFMDGDYSK